MPAALSDAQIHHIGTTRNRRGGEHLTNPSGALTMPDADAKLDRLMTMVGDVRVEVARGTERITALAEHSDRRDAEMKQLRQEIDELRARPIGLTGKQLLTALTAAAGGAAALVSIIDKVHIG